MTIGLLSSTATFFKYSTPDTISLALYTGVYSTPFSNKAFLKLVDSKSFTITKSLSLAIPLTSELLPLAPIIPATCVPCPIVSLDGTMV